MCQTKYGALGCMQYAIRWLVPPLALMYVLQQDSHPICGKYKGSRIDCMHMRAACVPVLHAAECHRAVMAATAPTLHIVQEGVTRIGILNCGDQIHELVLDMPLVSNLHNHP
jgi:hypothetical protein